MSGSKVLVIGKTGQVASALQRSSAYSPLKYHFAGRDEVELTSGLSMTKIIQTSRPDLVINCAAYTAVDKAEDEADLAKAVNETGPAVLAGLCSQVGIPLIHLSTDYVFAGDADRPYLETDPIQPGNSYGRSKAAGEAAVRAALSQHVIIRLAWVYGETGANFFNTMLRLGRDKRELGIVDDQFGTPSYTGDIARALDVVATQVLEKPGSTNWGTFHLTNEGVTSWYGFARRIFELARMQGYPAVAVHPISTADYPTPARRPAYSVLDCSKIKDQFEVNLRHWEDALFDCVEKKFDRAISF